MTDDVHPTWQDLIDLVTQLDGGDYDSAAVTFGPISVRLSKGALPIPDSAAPATTTPALGSTTGPVPAALVPTPHAAPTAALPDVAAEARGQEITSPMLGVFYRRPSAGAEPFVTPGDTVAADSTIGIIEIMKLMNPVVAGAAGTIIGFDIEDGASVQFGQVLARLDPAGR